MTAGDGCQGRLIVTMIFARDLVPIAAILPEP